MQRDSEPATPGGPPSSTPPSSTTPSVSRSVRGTPRTSGATSSIGSRNAETERDGWRHESTKALEGCRSPYFNAIKRRVALEHRNAVYRVELSELREVLLPWIRIPVFTYWRRRVVHGAELGPIETVARTFLETGHVPAQWFLESARK